MKLDEVLDTLDSYYELTDGWNGEDSYAPTHQIIDNSLAIYGRLSHLEELDITPNNNGTITFEWNTPIKYVSLEIGENGAALMVSPRDDTVEKYFKNYINLKNTIFFVTDDINSSNLG